jgi:hypothetical protein
MNTSRFDRVVRPQQAVINRVSNPGTDANTRCSFSCSSLAMLQCQPVLMLI